MKLILAIQHTYMLHKIIPSTAGLNNMAPHIQETFMALFRLINRPWFGRICVIQKVAARSGLNVHVICGRSSVTWGELLNAVYCNNDDLHTFLVALLRLIGHISAFGAACEIEEYNNIPTLLSLLMRHRSFESTDPRDRVFALLGLSGDARPRKLNIQPNYNLRVEEVYENMAILMLKSYGSLDILSFPRVSEISTIPGLPSWVPDWSISNFTEILTQYDWSDNFRYRFQAARGSKAEPRFTDDRMCLEPSGFVVDIIE